MKRTARLKEASGSSTQSPDRCLLRFLPFLSVRHKIKKIALVKMNFPDLLHKHKVNFNVNKGSGVVNQ